MTIMAFLAAILELGVFCLILMTPHIERQFSKRFDREHEGDESND